MNSFIFSGVVIHGKALGRTIGYPTANIVLDPGVLRDGVYQVRVTLSDSSEWQGIATYREELTLFEVHLLDYTGDLYDQQIRVEIVAGLRANKRFESLDSLVAQIRRDEELVRKGMLSECDRMTE